MGEEGRRGCPCVSVIKEGGGRGGAAAGRGHRWLGLGEPQEPPSRKAGMELLSEVGSLSAEWRWGGRPVCGSHLRPGCLETDQLARGKASSSEQD